MRKGDGAPPRCKRRGFRACIHYDMFAGGCDVCTNVNAKHIYANDINYLLIDVYKVFQSMSIDELLNTIDGIIDQWQLSKTNKDGYLSLRAHYNSVPVWDRNPIDLFVLICYSFNNQMRFNNHMEFNMPFGLNHSSFNDTMRNNLIQFHSKIQDIKFESVDFRDLFLGFLSPGDLVYADPPYLISTAGYNDGKRGFKGWSSQDDADLFSLLDQLNDRGVSFAMSNIVSHKGMTNDVLIEWSKKYNVHKISSSYSNCSYNAKHRNSQVCEVLITNY